jgi:Ca2+-binding RTX toxin-like protein
LEVLVAEDTYNAGEDAVVRQGQLIALVAAFLIGCAVVLMAGASGVQAEASQQNKQKHTEATNNEQGHSGGAASEGGDRCEGTRKINVNLPARFTTNDLPGCPQGGLLLGTDKPDLLAGEKGDDEVRGLGGKDEVWGGSGNDVLYGGSERDSVIGDLLTGYDGDDVIYGGPGDDPFLAGDGGNDVIYGGPGNDTYLRGSEGEDVIYGGPGADKLDGGPSEAVYGGPGELLPGGGDGQRDEIYCGEGRDSYWADKEDYVDSSCEVKLPNSLRFPKEPTGPIAAGGGPASGSPVPIPSSGGPAILLPAAALLFGSGILTYAILRRR